METMRIFATLFAAILGLAFGSFLNVCLSRWPYGESIVKPGSHCRSCEHKLAWWENIPLLSWIFLRGRCRKCRAAISWRYPLVEALVAALWAVVVWEQSPYGNSFRIIESVISLMIFYWLIVALATLDAENFWLPDVLTLGGLALGLVSHFYFAFESFFRSGSIQLIWPAFGLRLLECAVAASIILLIRWIYWLVRRKEGMGLGDAKLMAMLAAWLGLPGALLSLFLGVTLGAAYSVYLLIRSRNRSEEEIHNPDSAESLSAQEMEIPLKEKWAMTHLPLGTFLCIGGVISSLYGSQIIAAYLRWAGI